MSKDEFSNAEQRKAYIEALKVELAFAEKHAKPERVAAVKKELDRFNERPTTRTRETA